MSSYDIIIPVYNGYEVLEDCLESVKRHTGAEHRVILIDDASPDERVWPFLSAYADLPGFLVLRNASNMGFVGTVNRGMALGPDRPVILLNSDTIVTAGWVEKMDLCALSRPRVASVTALSNNATICSVPEWLVDNPLPPGHTVDSFAALVESISLRSYPEIPTAVGFCMLIRREALDAVGLFDAEAFARGYGEENDWCMRALDAGWVHLCDDATYIYHQGSVSFASAKDGQVSANYPVLMKRHPTYQDIIDDFIAKNPLDLVQHNLKRSLYASNAGLPGILYVLHNPIDGGLLGGTEFHVLNLAEGLADRYRIFVGYVRDNCFFVDEFSRHGNGLQRQRYAFELDDLGYQEIFRLIVETYRIDIVHVHHFLGHPESELMQALESFTGPKLLSIHDYYSVCRNYNLLYKHRHYCKLPKNDFTCSGCIRETQGWTLERLRGYRDTFQAGLKQFDLLVFPSESVRRDLLDYYGLDPAKSLVIPHGLSANPVPVWPGYQEGETLRVAFIGTLVSIKGLDTIINLIAENPLGAIEWHIWGAPHVDIPRPAKGRLIFHGAYERTEIIELLAAERIHLGLLPSICPETYSYTLSEYYAARIPVVGTSLGAVGERITQDRTGWTIEPGDVSGILSLLGQLIADPDVIKTVQTQANFSLPSTVDMCAAYASHYEELLSVVSSQRKACFIR